MSDKMIVSTLNHLARTVFLVKFVHNLLQMAILGPRAGFLRLCFERGTARASFDYPVAESDFSRCSLGSTAAAIADSSKSIRRKLAIAAAVAWGSAIDSA